MPSKEPDTGLDLTTLRVRYLTDWATHVPLMSLFTFIIKMLKTFFYLCFMDHDRLWWENLNNEQVAATEFTTDIVTMKKWPRVTLYLASLDHGYTGRIKIVCCLPRYWGQPRSPCAHQDSSCTLHPKISSIEWTVRPRSSETSLGSTKSFSSLSTRTSLTWMQLANDIGSYAPYVISAYKSHHCRNCHYLNEQGHTYFFQAHIILLGGLTE